MHFTTSLLLSSLYALSLALPQFGEVVQAPPGRLPLSYNKPMFRTYAATKAGGIDVTAKDSQPFTIKAYNSLSPEIHEKDIVVSQRKFFIGNLTGSYCPQEVKNCPVGNVTALKVRKDETARLDVQINKIQSVYVGPRAQLRFQPPGYAVPTNAQRVSFYLTDPEPSAFIFSGRGGVGRATGYLACPLAQKGVFQVFVDLGTIKDSWIPSGDKSDCIGFDALASNYISPAPAAYRYL